MFFKILLMLGICCSVCIANGQVPEVELVELKSDDPFMPKRYYRTISKHNARSLLRNEKRMEASFTGQFISLVRTKDRLLYHAYFAQFGNIVYRVIDGWIHYGITTHFDNPTALDNYLKGVVKPKAPDYENYFFQLGIPTSRFIQ